MSKNLDTPTILRNILLVITGFVIFQLLFGLILAEKMTEGMEAEIKYNALNILSNSVYVSYPIACLAFFFLQKKYKPKKTWIKAIMFLVTFIFIWVLYIVLA